MIHSIYHMKPPPQGDDIRATEHASFFFVHGAIDAMPFTETSPDALAGRKASVK